MPDLYEELKRLYISTPLTLSSPNGRGNKGKGWSVVHQREKRYNHLT